MIEDFYPEKIFLFLVSYKPFFRDAREAFAGVGLVNSIMILVRLPFERNERKKNR
jgi:hypothetical protein